MAGRDSRGHFARGNVPWNKKGNRVHSSRSRRGPCVHHWVIDDHDIGTCKKCGEVKDFGRLLAKEAGKRSALKAVSSYG